MVAFVLEVVNRFLVRNGLASASSSHSRTGNHKASRPPGSPRKRIRRTNPEPVSSDALPSFIISNNLWDPNYPSEATSIHKDGVENVGAERDIDDSGYFEWIDPSSGESFLVDSDTGNSFSRNQPPGYVQEGKTSNHGNLFEPMQTSYLDRRWLKASAANSPHGQNAEAKPATPTWLVNALKVRNPVGASCDNR